MSLATHRPVVRALETFAREHLGNPDSPVFARQQERFLELLRVKQEEWLTPHENEGAYGMSGAGGCLLKQDLRRDGIKGVPPEGSTQATWHHGHIVECELISFLEAIGCEIEGLQAPVRTYRADGSLLHSSKVDGIIVSAPPELELPTPCILSCKSTAYKMAGFVKGGKGEQKRRGFAALPFGVKSEEPSWWLQAQLELHGAGEWEQKCLDGAALSLGWVPTRWDGTTPAHVLLVAQAKDIIQAYGQDPILQDSGSLAFYAELIPYDSKLAETLCFARETYRHTAVVPKLTDDGKLHLVKLPAPGSPGGEGSRGFSVWGGPNQAATGTYNPCGMCEDRLHCSKTYGGRS